MRLTSYAVKRNRYTDQDEIHINKETKISDPIASELDFDIKPQQAGQDLATSTTVNDVIAEREARAWAEPHS